MNIQRFTIGTLAFLLTFGFGVLMQVQAAGPMTEKAGKGLSTTPSSQAFQTVAGKLVKIDGEFFVVEDPEGNQHRLHVNKRTVMLNGSKKPGDSLRAEVTKSGHAISIQ